MRLTIITNNKIEWLQYKLQLKYVNAVSLPLSKESRRIDIFGLWIALDNKLGKAKLQIGRTAIY
jgi:hypothetical protein